MSDHTTAIPSSGHNDSAAPLSGGMKALTLWQPWASLIAEGVKSIETRSWPAPAALVGERIAIHAAARKPEHSTVGDWHVDPRYRFGTWAPAQPRMWRDATSPGDLFASHESRPLPLGAVVATARLTHCLPMVPANDPTQRNGEHRLFVRHCELFRTSLRDRGPSVDISDQLPYGDFAPGRWAWLLDDIEKLPEPIPAKGRQGVWRWQP